MQWPDPQPMTTAPRDGSKVLVVIEFAEQGQLERRHALAYWTDPWDGMPGMWNENGQGDRVHPSGWWPLPPLVA